MPKILKCCIAGCHENSRNVMEEISFHRIPKDEVTRKQWTDLIRSKTNQPNVFSIHALVCSKHFKKDQFVERVNGSRLLTNNAIPSIFPNERRDCFKTGWSDNDDDERTDFFKNASAAPSATVVQPNKIIEMNSTSVVNDELIECSGSTFSVTRVERLTGGIDFERSCRFCLIIPVTTQTDHPVSNEDIASMYKSLTGIEFCDATYAAPVTICSTCSNKLKNAFEFREHLIKMNCHWQQLVKQSDAGEPFPPVEIDTKPLDIQPKLEIVIIEENNENSELEMIEEYVDDEIVDGVDVGVDAVVDDDVGNHRAESDEDDKFIQTVQDFIKKVKPTPPTKMKKIQISKPVGKVLSAKSAKIIAADTERLNFRSTSCPHSSQKLKKDNKWWRLMHDCNYCDAKDFLTVEAINKHLKLQHAELVKVTCDICKKEYSELKYLRKHMKYVHQTRQNECSICKKQFYYNYNLKSHMQIHTNEKTVICHLCGKFFTPSALHRHLRTGIHGPQEKIPNNKDQAVKNTRYYCHICVPAKRFNLCSDLTEHRRLLHNDFECPICKGWFSCNEALQNHLKTHSSKERKHKCTICTSTFTRASHLEGHMRRKHSSDPKRIACDLCKYKCVEPYELYGHKKHAHSTTRPYKCEICFDKSFSKEQAHRDHMLTTHDIGQYRYICSECPKRFTNSAGLIHHRGIHHNGAGNKTS